MVCNLQKLSKKSGFSLLELSVVLMTIGLLMVAVVKGSDLIYQARLTSARELTANSPVVEIDGLVSWWETTMPNSFLESQTKNNGSITVWYDISGYNPKNPNNAIAVNAPTYNSRAINNLPALNFNDSSSQHLNFNGNVLVNTNYVVFVVEKKTTSSGEDLFIGGTGGSANTRFHAGYLNNTTATFRQYSNDYNINSITSSYTSELPVIHTFYFSNINGKSYYQNGISRTLTASGSPNANQGLTAYGGAKIGGNDQYYGGYILEIIMFNRALSTQERQDVERYLGQKWGITVS